MENQNSLGNPPDNNLVWAILCTVLCCLPLGIVAIIKSTKVKELWAQGDQEGALKAAADAKKFSLWGAGIGLIFVIIYFILMAVGFAANAF
ncbi:MAG: CD225/dispanin family protein [Flavobacteriales bacterium]